MVGAFPFHAEEANASHRRPHGQVDALAHAEAMMRNVPSCEDALCGYLVRVSQKPPILIQ